MKPIVLLLITLCACSETPTGEIPNIRQGVRKEEEKPKNGYAIYTNKPESTQVSQIHPIWEAREK